MSLAQAVESARLNAPGKTVVTLDIERLPGSFTADFWDLNAFKGRRIHPDMVTEWPRTICAAWRWYGTKRVDFTAEWDGGAEQMLRAIWDVYDQADIVIGHNVAAFDTKHLATGWLEMGLKPPSPFKIVDTLKEARKRFGNESKTLASMCDRLGIDTKTDKYEVDVARAAVAGDKAAQRKLKAYNVGDIVASEALYDALRPWMGTHPHSRIGTADDRLTCPNCWGDNLERNGTKLAQQITYVLYRCRDCGANVQGTRHSRAATTRGAS